MAFAIHSHRISHGCTCVPHPEPPSHLPPHPIPQGRPSALALSALSHASNQDWRSVSQMVIHMFQCKVILGEVNSTRKGKKAESSALAMWQKLWAAYWEGRRARTGWRQHRGPSYNVVYTLRAVRNHWKVLSRVIRGSALPLIGIPPAVAAGWNSEKEFRKWGELSGSCWNNSNEKIANWTKTRVAKTKRIIKCGDWLNSGWSRGCLEVSKFREVEGLYYNRTRSRQARSREGKEFLLFME